MIRLFPVFLLLLTASATFAGQGRYCQPIRVQGFVYKATKANKDIYRHKNGTRLEVKCPPATITADDLINKYKMESSVRNTLGDAVYFEFDRERLFERVYVITRRPTVELIFSIHYKKRARLNETEVAVVSAYPKLK